MSANLLFEKKLIRGSFTVYSACPEFPVTTSKQTHSDIVQDENFANKTEGDGIIGSSLKAIGVLTADCIPVVLIGEKSHAIVHAGWLGLKKNIFQHPQLNKMHPTHAYIGPHIRVNHYEVQADFKNNFPHSTSFLEKDNKVFFNLTNEVTKQLQTLYPEIEISDCEICTYSDTNFESYRRNKTIKRNWNVYLPEGHLS